MSTSVQSARPAPERCDLSELPVEQCGCRKHRPGPNSLDVEPAAVRTYRYSLITVIPAKYSGTCAECGDRYQYGDPIVPQRYGTGNTGTGRWAHEECAQEVNASC